MQGVKIKNAMKEAGLTQENLARKIGVKQSEISRWVIGKRVPKLSTLKKISAATGKPLSFFVENSSGTIINTGSNAIIDKNQTVINSSDIELLKKDVDLQKKEMEILKLQIELLKKDKKK